ncbi:MAG: hypothetical protein HFG80_10775 [Eubacterium sp.]|nr:hypothetical protein [Eubacterium sp.]
MKKMWKRILTFVLAVGMLITTNGFYGLTVAYASTADGVYLRYTDSGGTVQKVEDGGSIVIDKGDALDLQFWSDSSGEVTYVGPSGGYDQTIINLAKQGNIAKLTGQSLGSASVRLVYGDTLEFFSVTILVQKDIATSSDITIKPDDGASYAYTGEEIKPISLTDTDNAEIAAGKDYNIDSVRMGGQSWREDFKNAGGGKIVVSVAGTGRKGENNGSFYYGDKETSYTIAPCDFGSGNALSYYNGEEHTNISYKVFLAANVNPVYTGSPLEPAVEVWAVDKASGEKLYKIPETATVNGTSKRNYNVSYSNNTLPGEDAEVTVTGSGSGLSGNCTGTLTDNFKIRANLNTAEITLLDPDNVVYTNADGGVSPELKVVYKDGTGEKELTKDTDYTAAFTNNTKAGTGTATITAIENGIYFGTKSTGFQIKRKNLGDADISVTAGSQKALANGAALTPATIDTGSIQVEFNGKTLTAGTDFRVKETHLKPEFETQGWVKDSMAVLTLEGVGNYEGEVEAEYRLGADLANVINKSSIIFEDNPDGNYKQDNPGVNTSTYNGREQRPALSRITLTDGTVLSAANNDYTLSYSNNKNAGTATVRITGTGEYAGTCDVTFRIRPKDISSQTDATMEVYVQSNDGSPDPVLYQAGDQNTWTSIEFTGLQIAENSIVRNVYFYPDGAGTGNDRLALGTDDFSLATKNPMDYHLSAGTKTIEITGKGNYTGTREINYKVRKIDLLANMDRVEVEWTGTAEYNGLRQSILPKVYYTDAAGKRTELRTTGTAPAIVIAPPGSDTDEDPTTNPNIDAFPKNADDPGDASDPEAVKHIGEVSTTLYPGVPYVKITCPASSNYEGEFYYYFEIKPFDLKAHSNRVKFEHEAIPDQPYTGVPIVVNAEVKVDFTTDVTRPREKPLEPGKDYVMDGEELTGPGLCMAKITGKNNYTGTLDTLYQFRIKYNLVPDRDQGKFEMAVDGQQITIENGALTVDGQTADETDAKINLTAHTASCNISEKLYTGSQIEPNINIIRYTPPGGGTKELVRGNDFTVTLGANKDVGSGSMVIQGISNNYMGTITLNFKIEENNFDDAEIVFVNNDGIPLPDQDHVTVEYTGEALEPPFQIFKPGNKLVSGDYYDTKWENNLNVGTATVKVTPKKGYAGGATEITKTFEITPVDISNPAKVQIPANTLMAYTGDKATVGGNDATLKPELVFISSTGTRRVLKYGTDYTIELPPDDDGEIGEHNMTIKAVPGSNFTGTATAIYTIQYDLSAATIVWYKEGQPEATTRPDYLYVPGANGVRPVALGTDADIAATNGTGFQVKMGTQILIPGTHYLVDEAGYKNNTILSKDNTVASVHIVPATGPQAKDVVGEKDITFRIVENDLSIMQDPDSGYNIDKNSLTVVYNGKRQAPEPVITYNGERLVKDEHYTLRYEGDRVNAHSTTAMIVVESIEGAGFKGTARIPFTIEPKPLVNDEGELNNIEVVGMEFFRAILVLEDTSPTTVIEIEDPNNPGRKIYCINNNINVTVNPFVSDQIYAQQSIFELNDQEKSGSNMVLGTDYRIEYVCLNGLQAGRNTYRFVGLGNYTGEYDLIYNVKYKFAESENGGKITVVENPPQIFGTTQTYDGQEITTSVDVRYDGGTPLREGADYEITYSPDNPPVDPGEITATISATENSAYYGSITRTFNIQGSLEEPNRVEVRNITDQFYTGEPLEPDVEVYWKKTKGGGETRLVKDKDYTVSYERNVEVSDPTRPSTLPIAIIEGKGNYTGRITKTFNIVKIKPINDGNIELGGLESTYYFTGRPQTINGLSVMFTDESGNQYALRQGTDYKLEYFNNTEVGTARIVITGVDRYEGSVTKTFRIIGNFGSKLSGCGVAVDPIPDQKYTGNPVIPKNINVFWNTASKQSIPLTEGKDYEIVSIEDNIEDGSTAKITIRALGDNYTGSFEATFKVSSNAPDNPDDPNQSIVISTGNVSISGLDDGLPYTGSPITPLPGHQLVYWNGARWIPLDASQYSIGAYRNNIEPGQASVDINANVNTTDNVSGTASITFNIIGDISGGFASVGSIPDQEYTAKPVEPDVQVTWLGVSGGRVAKTLTKGVDYDIEYSDNTEIGTATATITGKGNYSGTRTVNFQIVMGKIDPTKKIIWEENITLDPTEYVYDGTAKTPGVTVIVDGVTLTEGTDYTLEYRNNVKAGTAYAVVTGAGEYTNELEKPFTITPAVIHDNDVVLSQTAYTYDGKAKTPSAIVKVNGRELVGGTDYVVGYKNNVKAGTATATITGRGNYSGTVNKAFTILSNGGGSSGGDATSIANARVSGIASRYTYTGSQIKPSIVVRDANGRVLTLNKDYTIQYFNNINAGTGWVVINGIGNYSGLLTPPFTIVKKNVNNCAISIPKSAVYTGSEIRPMVTAKNGSKKMIPGSDYSVTYSNNKKLGKATVTVRGEGNFTGTKKIYFNIIVQQTKNLKLSSSKRNSVTLKWTKVAKASGYEVYTSNLKKKVATVTKNKNSVTIKKLKNGSVYKYRVRAYIKQGGKKYYGAFSNTVTATTAPKAVKTTLSSNAVNTVVVKWNKVSGSGYQVYRSVKRNSGYRKIATVTSSSKRSYTDRRAASGGVYYYKVRAYKKSGGKYIYGAFSTPNQVTSR